MKVWILVEYCGDFDSLIGVFSSEQNAIKFVEDMCKQKSEFEGNSKDDVKTWFCDKGENRGLYQIYTSDSEANKDFLASIEQARKAGVPEDKILKSINDIDNFFMGG